jgi:hypothetical protein
MSEFVEIFYNICAGAMLFGIKAIPFTILYLGVVILAFDLQNRIKKTSYSKKIKLVLYTLIFLSVIVQSFLIISLVIYIYK